MPLVDIDSGLREHGIEPLPDGIHLSAEGNEFVASQVADAIWLRGAETSNYFVGKWWAVAGDGHSNLHAASRNGPTPSTTVANCSGQPTLSSPEQHRTVVARNGGGYIVVAFDG